MILTAKIHDKSTDTFTGKKGPQTQRSYVLLDVGEGRKMKQMIEYQTSMDAVEMNIGDQFQIEVTEIQSIFSGRPRIRGVVRLTPTSPAPVKKQ